MRERAPEICVIYSTVPPVAVQRTWHSAFLRRTLSPASISLPVRSLYRWKGESCDDEEHLLIIKTRRSLADAVIRALKAMHPYEVPEIIVLPVIAGHAPYLDWVYAETNGP